MVSEDYRCQRGGNFLVSVFNVSAESLAELHHSGAWLAQADAASSSLFFLAAVLARSGQVLRWRLDPAFSSTTRIAQVDEREHFVAMTKGQCSTTVNGTLSPVHRANFSIIVTRVDTRAKEEVCYVNILRWHKERRRNRGGWLRFGVVLERYSKRDESLGIREIHVGAYVAK